MVKVTAIAIASLFVCGAALAEAPKPGAENKAIDSFTRSASWTGKLPKKAPDAPDVPTHGKMDCKWVAGDAWNVCDIEDFIGAGDKAHVWRAVWVSGWDPGAKEYRGYIVDSTGMSSLMKGVRDGQKLVYESIGPMVMRGQPSKLRFTFDASEGKEIKFTAEHQAGAAWVIDEQEVHVATRK